MCPLAPSLDSKARASLSSTSVWIRLPGLLLVFSEKILLAMGNWVGKAIKVDQPTLQTARGKCALICVEVDLSKFLIPRIQFLHQSQNVEYEGLHLICFGEPVASTLIMPAAHHYQFKLDERYGPWMLVQSGQRGRPEMGGYGRPVWKENRAESLRGHATKESTNIGARTIGILKEICFYLDRILGDRRKCRRKMVVSLDHVSVCCKRDCKRCICTLFHWSGTERLDIANEPNDITCRTVWSIPRYGLRFSYRSFESSTLRLLDWNDSMTDIQLGMRFVDKVQAVSAVWKWLISVGREYRVGKCKSDQWTAKCYHHSDSNYCSWYICIIKKAKNSR
ncbi:hypothetical protein M9H77_07470 [Catharanthus roseus]|uniref:Uncharacterized protein n=1 Tax=Catharanthus roseus TaxID=4058 RepID=A0ACC0BV04_CATRO|nr:hypothetical protein M9H77_07470 [Catharanthus roseus]